MEYAGDGKIDRLAIDASTGHLYRYTGNGSGGFAAAVGLGTGWGTTTTAPGDVNGAGRTDFLPVNSSSAASSFYRGNGDGTRGNDAGSAKTADVLSVTKDWSNVESEADDGRRNDSRSCRGAGVPVGAGPAPEAADAGGGATAVEPAQWGRPCP